MSKNTSLSTILKAFLQGQKLVDQKLLLMVSGGIDSMVLLDVALKTLELEQFAVFHLNHNSRVKSVDDLIFVQNICSKNNIKFYGEKLDTQPEKNIEASWRGERKRLSKKAASEFGAAKILTGHHATDLTETMIFRLTKGAGPSGLAPFDTSTKPFWNIPKQALLEYAEKNQLEWQEDDSNLNTKFKRNLIRHDVLPALRKITPHLESVFVRESETFAQLQDFLNEQLQTHCALEIEQQAIALDKFLNLHPTLQNELLRTIATKTPSQAELSDCLKWLLNNPAGGSKKDIGAAALQIQNKQLQWQT